MEKQTNGFIKIYGLPVIMVGDLFFYFGKRFGQGVAIEIEPMVQAQLDRGIDSVKDELDKTGKSMETSGSFLGKRLGSLLRRER